MGWATARLDVDGHRVPARVVREGDVAYVHERGANLALEERPRFPERVVEVPRGGCVAPMQGTIVKVLVEVGQADEVGAGVVVLEAMKMENQINAEKAGTVKEIKVATGDTVGGGDILAVIE